MGAPSKTATRALPEEKATQRYILWIYRRRRFLKALIISYQIKTPIDTATT